MAQHKSGLETKKRIYDAAEKLFYEHGYVNTKVTDIIDLSDTNKGSFYHHYQNKADLGMSVFNATVEGNYHVAQLFENPDSLVGLSLELAIFWYTYFQDDKSRRFSAEINSHGIIREDDRVYDICMKNTKKRISDKEFSLIRVANVALYKQLTVYFYDQTKRFNFVEARDFYLKNLFGLFGIPKEQVESALKESMNLFWQLDIRTEGFNVQAKLR